MDRAIIEALETLIRNSQNSNRWGAQYSIHLPGSLHKNDERHILRRYTHLGLFAAKCFSGLSCVGESDFFGGIFTTQKHFVGGRIPIAR